jgi:hypothetical protein
MRRTRRGESALEFIGGLVVLVLIGLVVWWFVTGKSPREAIDRVVPEPPKPVVLGHRYDYKMFEDSSHLVTVKNVGGAGKVRVTLKVYRDKAETRLVGTFSRVVHLDKGEQREVVVQMSGVKEGLSGVYVRPSAEPASD